MFVALEDFSDPLTSAFRMPTPYLSRPEVDADTYVVKVPDDFVTPAPESPGKNPLVAIQLAAIGERQQTDPAMVIREQRWRVTRDPAAVTGYGDLHHDCEDCQAATAMALELLAAGKVVAIGVLSLAAA